jgi:pSer/pThr/pTyr-binding forkhead associated (FHA) protein
MQSQLPAYLLKGADEVYSLKEPLTRLGRTSENQIRIASEKASRNHAEILYENGSYWLRDLNSKNGSWVNNQPVKAELRQLKDGDLLRVGGIEFRFSEAELLETVTDKTLRNSAQSPVLEVNEERHEVRLGGKVVEPPLTATEWKLLQFLYVNQHRVCSRSELIRHVWLPQVADHRTIIVADYKETIETHISRLRRKLSLNTKSEKAPRLELETVKTYGYRLVLY